MAEVAVGELTPSNADSSARRRFQRSRTACRNCRQAKVKCGMKAGTKGDALQQLPCARCQRLGHACEWLPEFKRTNNATRVHDIEQQLQALQSQQGHQQQTPPSESHVARSNGHTTARTPISLHTSKGSQHPSQTGEVYTVRDLQISVEDTDILFGVFFDKYHVHLPFISRPEAPAKVYGMCEFLFWAILSVAARHHTPSSNFISRLSPHLSEYLASIVVGSPKHWHLGHVQALILMSLYPPFRNTTFFGDRSVALANIALTGAMYLGLHSGQEQEYGSIAFKPPLANSDERRATWAACVAVAHNHSIDFGVPSQASFDNEQVLEVCTRGNGLDAQISTDLHHYLLIQQRSSAAFAVLSRSLDSSDAGILLADMLVQEVDACDDMSTSLSGMSLLNRLRVLAIKMQIQVIHLQLPLPHAAREEGLRGAYRTASRLVSTAISDNGGRDVLLYSPRTTFRCLHHAACVLFKVLHSSYGALLDYEAGKVLFDACLLCMQEQAVPIYDHHPDLPLRSAKVLRGLWQMGEQQPEMKNAPPEMCIRTRGSASIDYDCLAIYFNRVGELRRRRQQQDVELNGSMQVSDSTDRASPDVGGQWPDFTADIVDFPMDLTWLDDAANPDVLNFL